MNAIEKKLKLKITEAVDNNLQSYTPGLCVQVVHGGRLKIDLEMGRTWHYYDLASLTKILFATTAMMNLAEEKSIVLTDSVSKYLADWPHPKVKIDEVLSHSAGLSWWAPFYKMLQKKKFTSEEAKREAIKNILYKIPLGSKRKSIYSDLDFILLGFLIERCRQASLIEVWQAMEWRTRAPGLHFNVGNKPRFNRDQYAPTEKCPWRKKVLQGEVHDDNTWSFGGISTHAGLFGTTNDVTAYGQLLRRSYRGDASSSFVGAKWVKRFAKRAVPPSRGDFGLGFFLPTRGSASCGKYFSRNSFGHTGFTGTSFWYDPRKDLQVVILSNRVHPSRENRKFVQLRPVLHNLIVEALGL